MEKNTLRPLMLVGTGSDVGKSVLTTAFGRIFWQDGYRPAPFKAQNMSLNSYATPEGLEIGRAQAVQAEACGIACSVHMNPILLKPTGDQHAQLVLNGRPQGTQSAKAYFEETDRDMLFAQAMRAYDSLKVKYNPMLIEGAGSISEMNLWPKDITNMRVAQAADAAVILVADIDRGGVFAAVYGSIALLPLEQKQLIKGVIINKFRGDLALFSEGRKMLEAVCGKPVLGVVPYMPDIAIEEEDSVSLDQKPHKPMPGQLNVAVLRLGHLSNFTDFDAFEQIPGVHLYYTREAQDLKQADILLIPGSKNTIADMLEIRRRGLEPILKEHHHQGKPVYGICGGFQIMGQEILDPDGVEGTTPRVEGLGMLPVSTLLTPEKRTLQCHFRFFDGKASGKGYEIHMGRSTARVVSPLCFLEGSQPDGFYLNEATWGTYIHGIFDNTAVLRRVLGPFLGELPDLCDRYQQKEQAYNKLADWVRKHVDMPKVYQIMQYA